MNCQVCYSCFDHSRHKPYSLSCPHTFCISCLNQLKNDLCPLCKNKIKSKHPNLALIEVLPKSSYDLLKEESLKHYYEASELIQTLNNAQETKLVEIKKAREQIKATSDLWIKIVKTHNRELIAKVDALHGKTKEDLNKYNVSKDSTIKLNSLKQLLENNELDEIELNMLNDENIERKSNISKSLNEIENYQKCNFLKNDFIETIALKENLIGQIKTFKEVNRLILFWLNIFNL